ncbi:hypothetical protein AFE02nite_28420 [Actinotalea fermentans]|uniref:Uncharacterized protein n=1 Tax=Actinotalea fermentans TaxID=43671 RepID=A0A511Z0X0_9CELL|nr:hypothetical protein [Actinotalea fermentans]GEN81108.1 hypothetical protein AFE02nite_28420 [Actinotalea fermentans]
MVPPWNPSSGSKEISPVAGSSVYVPSPGTVTVVAGSSSASSRVTEPSLGIVIGVAGDCAAGAVPVEVSGVATGPAGARTVGVYVAVSDCP